MKHRIGYNRLGRKASHRKALVKNMVTQLYRHERIRTTKSKALEVRRKAEKLITRAKEDTVHNRRIVAKLIQDKAILAKLFTEIAPGFTDRPGGYTRILKLGFRKGDAAELVLLELVEQDDEAAPRKKASKPEVKEEPVEVEAQPETAVEADEEAPAEASDDAAGEDVETATGDTDADDGTEEEASTPDADDEPGEGDEEAAKATAEPEAAAEEDKSEAKKE